MRLQDTTPRWRAGAGTLATVRVVITEIGWDGSIRRRAVGTGSLVRGFAADRLTGCPVKLDRTRYVAISIAPAQRARSGSGVPLSVSVTAPGLSPRPPSGGTLVAAVSLRRPAGIAGRRRLVPMASH
jgi:hypothetical protein